MNLVAGAVRTMLVLAPLASTGAGRAVPEVSVVAVVVIWAHGIESPAAPSLSAPPVEALKVTLPLLLTIAAVSTPPVRSPPTPATAVPLPTVPAAGEKVMTSMVPTDDKVGVAPV